MERDYVTVPREPTEAMVEAGVQGDLWNDTGVIARLVRDVWSAMLAAAPPAPTDGVERALPTREADDLRVLIAKATDEDLTDGGRYFAETYTDLTRCRHEEIGEYQNRHDGPLVEWLWNNRRMILALIEGRSA